MYVRNKIVLKMLKRFSVFSLAMYLKFKTLYFVRVFKGNKVAKINLIFLYWIVRFFYEVFTTEKEKIC